MKMIDLIRQYISGEIPPPPVSQLVGFTLISCEAGESVMEMETDTRHSNPMGTLHGGILCDIADAAMGIAYASLLDEGESFTTLELKINFLKPVWKSKLRANGKVVKQGKTAGMVECTITDQKGDLIAKASSTCLTLRGEQAKGR